MDVEVNFVNRLGGFAFGRATNSRFLYMQINLKKLFSYDLMKLFSLLEVITYYKCQMLETL